ncbi:MAG: PQQ-binding-like beta-propeller repeat protein [Bacteroidales bacterium]|nr:PQQ-binding-like beta-propeller repeat protein [Bacteroidales bacterium]
MRTLILTILICTFTTQSFISYSQQARGTIEDLASTPDLAWKFSLPAPVFSSPALSSGYLVFSSAEGMVYCLKAGD